RFRDRHPLAGRPAMVRGLPLAREETHLKDAVRYRVFGADAFPGNPATLIECASLDDGAALQAQARRLPAGDMAFYAHARADAIDGWHVRFFSHSREIQLCGHALLALAHHLQSHSILQSMQGRHRVRWRDGRCWVSLPARTCS